MGPSQSPEPLLRGDPVEAMDTAKQIIGGELAVDSAGLAAILMDKKSPKWARIAAIYSLGFLAERSTVPALVSILSDHGEPVSIRAHAAEALGNVGDAEAVPALAQVMQEEVSPSLRRSSLYALKEIDHPAARAALDRVRQQRPRPMRAG
jgi:FXSXX-COOH protein